ncbi:MAG TPA: HD domain-containing protein [bacterium]|nr:HD domain-containing protein [bacterium]HOL48478.1 HD domain-containing protein [bacterium]HPQ17716.1 HD domain-containing protein [bacterium]
MFQNPLSEEIYTFRKKRKKKDVRDEFFRDQTIIIHSMAFRRLRHKTQVFFEPESDHICVRLEHVLHVSTIAASICKGLNLNVELAEAIALGHDLGHSPFGHAGESALNNLILDEGGFMHEIHSLRVVDKLAKDGEGLNLTYAVRDGIVSHCGESFEQYLEPAKEYKDLEKLTKRNTLPLTNEGCVVRMSDKIAYLGRDIEDALAARLIKKSDIPEKIKKGLGSTNGEIISKLVDDIILTSRKTGKIGFSDKYYELMVQLKDFNYKYIYAHKIIQNYIKFCQRNIKLLFEHYIELFDKNKFEIKKYLMDENSANIYFGKYLEKIHKFYIKEKASNKRIVIDYIAGMSDNFAHKCVHFITFPKAIHFYF